MFETFHKFSQLTSFWTLHKEGRREIRSRGGIWHLTCVCVSVHLISGRKELHASLHLFTLSLFISIVQVHGRELKNKHVRMWTGRGLAAEEINKNTWKHIIGDSVSWALLTTSRRTFEGVCLFYQTGKRQSTLTGACALSTVNNSKWYEKEKHSKSWAEPFMFPAFLVGCVHQANLLPKLFTLQSVNGHILKPMWAATQTWKEVWSRPLGLCERIRSTSTRFSDECERFTLIKCSAIC